MEKRTMDSFSRLMLLTSVLPQASRAQAAGSRFLGMLLLATMVACSVPGPAPRASDGSVVSPSREANTRRALTMAISREPTSLEPSLQPQNREWSALGSGFLAYFSPNQAGPVPYLAKELPSTEKGTWRVLPDGRMETTYTLKENATWHDGQPITAQDWVFGYTVRTDPDFPGHSVDVERRLARVVAVDDHTLFLEWPGPYLWAGMIHLPDFPPLPRHTLEPMYLQDRASFFDGPQWREEFVGSGPFRVVSWEPGVELVFKAHESFVLGKPGLDEIRVRFLADANMIVANLLSGNLDMSFSTTIGFPQGEALEQTGWNGTVEYWPGLPRYIEYQGRDWGNTQPAVFDARVRRASNYAIDRASIADVVYGGHARVAYYWLSPIDPAYPAVDKAVPKYAYDPNRAQALLSESGWV